ncbi:hypothetical protein VTI74DRAFT_2826 [Chaetomium olivicolor]
MPDVRLRLAISVIRGGGARGAGYLLEYAGGYNFRANFFYDSSFFRVVGGGPSFLAS